LSEILYVITDLLIGGVPLHLRNLALRMRRRGYGIRVISLAPPGRVAEILQEDGVPVDSCHGACGWDLRIIGRLAGLIRQHRPDLIHALLFHGNVASRWAARRAGFPRQRIICEIQTVEVERRWHLIVDRFTHQGCRFTIGNSPSVIEHLATHAHIPRERLRLVRGGVNLERIDQAEPVSPTALGLRETDRIVLWVGRLDPVKGLDLLIDAFSAVPAHLNAHLLLAGAGAIREQLGRQIASSRLTDRVHLLGSRDDVPSLLKTADLFVLPSRTEGLPNALLEAMAAGRPVITTNVPGCRDLIRHEVNGLKVPFGDREALSRAIVRMLSDGAMARRLARQARATAESDWRIELTYDAYEAAYREILDEPR
jgi:glycosyltransferase involved in cell wall biosynthesis